MLVYNDKLKLFRDKLKQKINEEIDIEYLDEINKNISINNIDIKKNKNQITNDEKINDNYNYDNKCLEFKNNLKKNS